MKKPIRGWTLQSILRSIQSFYSVVCKTRLSKLSSNLKTTHASIRGQKHTETHEVMVDNREIDCSLEVVDSQVYSRMNIYLHGVVMDVVSTRN